MKINIHFPDHWKKIAVLLFWMGCSFVSYSQNGNQIKGKVTDEMNQSIPGVNVLVKGTFTGSVTDSEGNYNINVPPGNSTLVFSFIGYQTQEVEIGNQTEINVSLKASLSDMDEVVVVGYGEQSRETLTTSVSKMDQRVLENVPYANLASAMQGALSG